jgi:5-aminovalerate/4-aminobutyrate aminotransferase
MSRPIASPRSSSSPCRAKAVYIAPKDFMVRLRELCDRHGIILIADEIRAARPHGRHVRDGALRRPGGPLHAREIDRGRIPAQVVGRADVMDACGPGGLGGTYAGNPVARAAALAVLQVFEEERIFERAERLGERIGKALDALSARTTRSWMCAGSAR